MADLTAPSFTFPRSAPGISYTLIPAPSITSYHLTQAAALFTAHYGIWGPHTLSPLRSGERVRMTPARLRRVCLPESGESRGGGREGNGGNSGSDGSRGGYECTHVRATLPHRAHDGLGEDSGEGDEGELVGSLFACRWQWRNVDEKREVCWITQLVVHSSYRSRGVATGMFDSLREAWSAVPIPIEDRRAGKVSARGKVVWGVLSSHAHTICAVTRLGGGLERVDLAYTAKYGQGILASSPIEYVRTAKLRGPFESDEDGVYQRETGQGEAIVTCADTGFFVDHAEPDKAVESVKKRGREWKFGTLPVGCEFLTIVEGF